jgi:predicted esterase
MAAEFRSLVVSRHARVGVVGDPVKAREAWLILHGYGMLARGILHWFRGAEHADRLLVAPEGLSRFYTELSGGKRSVGASWVTREDLEHELEDQFAYLERVVAECVPEELRLEVHGFSQGVSAATRWTVRTARPVDRLVGWAGIVPADVTGALLTQKLGERPLHLVVGNDDARVTPDQVEADAARLRDQGMAVEVHRFAGGHRIDLAALV